LDLYYEKRPSDNGSRWRPPRPGFNIFLKNQVFLTD
jgi:hypothetical protein